MRMPTKIGSSSQTFPSSLSFLKQHEMYQMKTLFPPIIQHLVTLITYNTAFGNKSYVLIGVIT